jgi:hypothetical protein
MTGDIPRSYIDRRALLSTLALVPVFSAPLASISASAQTATSSLHEDQVGKKTLEAVADE